MARLVHNLRTRKLGMESRPPFARLLSVPENTVALWEKGEMAPRGHPRETLLHLDRFCDVLASSMEPKALVRWLTQPQAAIENSRPVDLAPHAKIRSQIVPCPSPVPSAAPGPADSPTTTPQRPARVKRWAELLARVFGFDLQVCPDCGGSMKIVAALLEPAAVRTILTSLALPDKPPELTPAQIPFAYSSSMGPAAFNASPQVPEQTQFA